MRTQLIKVGYYSPGWPRSHCPNGIVSYLDNLRLGTKNEIETYIFSENIAESATEGGLNVVDLSKIPHERSVFEKVYHRVAYKSELSFLKVRRQSILAIRVAKLIAEACNQLESLDLIELEESFGLGYFLTKMTKLPVVTRLHGPWFIQGQWSDESNAIRDSRINMEKKSILTSIGLTSPSQAILNLTQDYYQTDLSRCVVIPNPVQPPNQDDFWDFAQAAKKNVLFVGRFDNHKGADLALKAFRIVAQQDKEVLFNFVGPDSGLIEGGTRYYFRQYVQAFIPEQHVRNRIIFHGHCDAEKITSFRKMATVTLMTSRFENFSLALLEGLAAGSPIVATAVGGNTEIVTDEFNGILAYELTPECIAEKVISLLNDEVKMLAISKAAISDVNKRFSPEVIAAQTLAYYNSIL